MFCCLAVWLLVKAEGGQSDQVLQHMFRPLPELALNPGHKRCGSIFVMHGAQTLTRCLRTKGAWAEVKRAHFDASVSSRWEIGHKQKPLHPYSLMWSSVNSPTHFSCVEHQSSSRLLSTDQRLWCGKIPADNIYIYIIAVSLGKSWMTVLIGGFLFCAISNTFSTVFACDVMVSSTGSE